jgi:hypothetical protein
MLLPRFVSSPPSLFLSLFLFLFLSRMIHMIHTLRLEWSPEYFQGDAPWLLLIAPRPQP